MIFKDCMKYKVLNPHSLDTKPAVQTRTVARQLKELCKTHA